MSTGQHCYVSVIVGKGSMPGKRIALTSGVHGDEMSVVHTVPMVVGRLNPVGSDMEGMQRRWPSSGPGFQLSAVSRQAGLVFSGRIHQSGQRPHRQPAK
jgi:hypothetical protein